MKKIIRLTESDLHRIVKESVKSIMNADTSFERHIAERIIDDIQTKNLNLSGMNRKEFITGVMSNYCVDRKTAEVTADMAGMK